jgi:hypothetical protein
MADVLPLSRVKARFKISAGAHHPTAISDCCWMVMVDARPFMASIVTRCFVVVKAILWLHEL